MWVVFGKNIDFFDNCVTINAKGEEGMQQEYPVLELANYICSTTSNKGKTVTNLQLQKTLYYIQGYFMKCLHSPAFGEDIYNWQYGPVVPEAYFEYNTNLSNPIQNIDVNAADEFDSDLRKKRKTYNLLHQVIDKCLKFTARELVSKTHREDPWKNTELRQKIDKSTIERYFADNDPLGLE